MADRRRIEARSREVDFYRRLLNGYRPGDLIFDVGANAGDKTDVFLRLGARVVAVEPDEANQGILRERFLSYRLAKKPVDIIGKAVSETATIETMWIDGPGSALNTLSQKWAKTLHSDRNRFTHASYNLDFGRKREVETITLERLMATHGIPFFVKIDVEGYESKALRGLRRPVPYLSFEVNLPEFRTEGLECIELLRRLAADGTFNYAADCQRGLVLDRWVPANEISRALDQCTNESIEVFWKTSASVRA
jgi:FkbM family methyltransferase